MRALKQVDGLPVQSIFTQNVASLFCILRVSEQTTNKVVHRFCPSIVLFVFHGFSRVFHQIYQTPYLEEDDSRRVHGTGQKARFLPGLELEPVILARKRYPSLRNFPGCLADIRQDISPTEAGKRCISLYISLVYIDTNGLHPSMLLSPA